MSTISRHILYQSCLAFGIIITILISISWMINALKLFENVIAYGFSWSLFFLASLLPSPKFLIIFLPLAAFLAILFSYARMEKEGEIAALKAGGLGIFQLTRPALIFAGIITIFAYGIMLYLLPLGLRHFVEIREQMKDIRSSSLVQAGTFIDVNRHFTFYIQKKEGDGTFHGIFIHDARDQDNPLTIIAETGRVLDREGGIRFVLNNGSRQSFSREKDNFSLLDFDSYTFDFDDGKSPSGKRWLRPDERYIHQLIVLKDEDMPHRTALSAHLHYRLLMPLYVVAFVLIALYTTLHDARPRHSHVRRYAIATAVVFILELLMFAVSRYSERHIWGIGGMYLLTLGSLYVPFHLLYLRQ